MVCQENVDIKIVKPESTVVSTHWCFLFEVLILKKKANKQSNLSSLLYLVNFGACREISFLKSILNASERRAVSGCCAEFFPFFRRKIQHITMAMYISDKFETNH